MHELFTTSEPGFLGGFDAEFFPDDALLEPAVRYTDVTSRITGAHVELARALPDHLKEFQAKHSSFPKTVSYSSIKTILRLIHPPSCLY